MIKLITCLSIIIFYSVWSSAQSTFQKGVVDKGIMNPGPIRSTYDGGYIAIGGSDSLDVYDYGYMYIVKMDSLGDTLWTRYYFEMFGMDIRQISDSNFLVVGLDRENNFNFLFKINLNGDTIWTREYSAYPVATTKSSLDVTYDNDILLVGSTELFGAGFEDGYLIKANANGDTLWTRIFGGPGPDELVSVKQAPDSNYILAGSTQSFGSGGYDVYLIKVNQVGDTLWTRTFGTADNESVSEVLISSDSNYIIIGSRSNGSSGDIFLMKVDADGNLVWLKNYGNGSTYFDSHHISITSDKGFILAGESNLSLRYLFVLKLDSGGDTLWTKTYDMTTMRYGSYSSGSGCAQTIDGGYIFTAAESDTGGFVFLKTDSTGIGACNYLYSNVDITQPVWQVTNTNTIVNSGSLYERYENRISIFGNTVTYCKNIVDIDNPKIENRIIVSPNLSIRGSKIKIDVMNFSDIYTLRIFDIFGKEIKHIDNISGDNLEISTNIFSEGLYLFELNGRSQTNHFIGKFVITSYWK